MAGDERSRLFCALQVPDEIRADLAAWRDRHLRVGRPVHEDDLHVTLAFLGSRPAYEVPAIVAELRAAAREAGAVELRPARYRETRSVGMIVLEDVGGGASALAEDLQGRLERLGVYRRERRRWLPHVTLVRFREPAGLAPPLANTCSIHVVRSALYRSPPGPGARGAAGPRYDVLETAALGGN